MKRNFSILLILISTKLFGCKCEEMSIQESFKYADFVFVGKVYDIVQIPSGFKTVNDFISKVNIKKVYKLNSYSEFYKNNAILFSSQLRSCDLFYEKNVEYLIFGFIEPDTGMIYSEFCTQTKTLNKVSKEDLNLLENLQKQYLEKDKNIAVKPFIEELETFTNQPNILVNKLKRKTDLAETKYVALKTENKNLKIILIVVLGISIIGIIIKLLKNHKK